MKQIFDSSVSFKKILLEMDQSDKIHWDDLPDKKRSVLESIMLCHTEACGFSVSSCTECGHQIIHYGSCNNPCCPECGCVRREKWLDRQRNKIVNAPANHIIFTIPSELNKLFLAYPRECEDILFKAQHQALKEISRDEKYFGAETIGCFSVIHTWGATLVYHPHIHTVFYGVGLDQEGNLVYPKHVRVPGTKKRRKKKKDYLFPSNHLARLFKQHCLDMICRHFEYTGSPWLEDLRIAKSKKWQVKICDTLKNPETVIEYLGRYVNRTAISNSRIKSYDGQKVGFLYKDYKDNSKVKMMYLTDTEFLKRFLRHIPPKGFTGIRHYGFMSNNSKKKLQRIKELTHTDINTEIRTTEEILRKIIGENFNKCPKCKGEIVIEAEEYKPRWTADFVKVSIQKVREEYRFCLASDVPEKNGQRGNTKRIG